MLRNHLFLLRFLVILNLMFLFQSYPSMAASPEKRVALVIGNSAYQNTPPLANPRNDATEMGKVLKRIGFDVDVVVDATKPQMDQALRRFGNNLAGSIAAVFYYAGHGIQVDGIRIGPQVLAFYHNLLNLRPLFNNQKKLKSSPVFKWLDISELKMPKLVDLCGLITWVHEALAILKIENYL
ncbi:MAG: caspase family protein [Deltaproteobacteria bacterium]